MDFLELVRATRTCRKFRQAEGLPEGTLTWLVECARLASCAGNAQALRFALAESAEACKAVYDARKEIHPVAVVRGAELRLRHFQSGIAPLPIPEEK